MRADVNVSVRKAGGEDFRHADCEIKNVNSVRFVDAVRSRHEARRQVASVGIEGGGAMHAGDAALRPRPWRDTRSMRSKEDAHDYRYFPDPDSAAAGAGSTQFLGR